jgi:hypothetical protein
MELKEDLKASEVGTAWKVPDDADRKPRTAEVMKQQAEWMKSLFEQATEETSESSTSVCGLTIDT